MYNYSMFANGLLMVTSAPTVAPTSMAMAATATVAETKKIEIPVITDPFQANATITYTTSAAGKATVAAKEGNNKIAVVTGVDEGSATITATDGTVTATCTVTVEKKAQEQEELQRTIASLQQTLTAIPPEIIAEYNDPKSERKETIAIE